MWNNFLLLRLHLHRLNILFGKLEILFRDISNVESKGIVVNVATAISLKPRFDASKKVTPNVPFSIWNPSDGSLFSLVLLRTTLKCIFVMNISEETSSNSLKDRSI